MASLFSKLRSSSLLKLPDSVAHFLRSPRPSNRVAFCDAQASESLSQMDVSQEIKFFRDARNNFGQSSFSDVKQPYGPPLAIILPHVHLQESLLVKLMEVYGEKGFDVVTVNLTASQLMFPCVAGGAMNVVTSLLEYLNETHKHRPYVFHGFSVGAYVFGEILAQFTDHYDSYRVIMNNVKGCLWDSPVDFCTARCHVGRALYPKNWFRRWRCNAAVRRHFKKHHHDSVSYWLRARENFCNPPIKVPNVFFVSYTDVISNPCTLHTGQKLLECNGIPVYQKSWWDSRHGHHFEKYCYEYLYGMELFFNLANLHPDDNGKYRSTCTTATLLNLRLRKKAREDLCP